MNLSKLLWQRDWPLRGNEVVEDEFLDLCGSEADQMAIDFVKVFRGTCGR